MNKAFDLDLTECRKAATEASSLPPKCYTSDDIAEIEIETVFRKSWIGVGRSDMVRSAGDFITFDIAKQNVVLLRDTEGKLRAFANSCRHRAARVVNGSGSCKGLRCPFHSWFYGLDGKLVAAPHMESATGFDKSEYGLVAYRAEERAGFVFICLSADAPDLDTYLGDFTALHSPWPLESLVTVRRQEVEVDCNWKMFIEVFNEYYHLPFVHPDSIDNVYALPEPADEVEGAFATQFGMTDGTGGLLESDQQNALPSIPGLPADVASGARYTWIFPNMTFAANHDALWSYEAYPLGPNRCTVIQTACFPTQTAALPDFKEKSQAYLDRMDAALAEDIPALENQQKGMLCPDAKAGRFQPNLEPNVASFARWYASLMD